MFKRDQTKIVKTKNIAIGGSNDVIIQSMTTTKTSDVNSTLKQINTLYDNGSQWVRVSLLDKDDINALKQIVKKSPCPIIGDIHYNYEFALKAIEYGVSKIRINPGNINNIQHLQLIANKAKEYNVAIRLGFNTGSLPKNTKSTPNSIINEAVKYIKLFEKWKFNNLILSFKSSNYKLTYDLYKLASLKIKYPLHLGVTEAGTLINSTIKHTLCCAPLLTLGIGNTIRVSISGLPDMEPIIAKQLLIHSGVIKKYVEIIACPTCGRCLWRHQDLVAQLEKYTNKINKNIKLAIMGCSVNGIGECKQADIGVYGSKNKLFIYYKGKQYKTVDINNGFKILCELIDKF